MSEVQTKAIHEILEEFEKCETRWERIKFLQDLGDFPEDGDPRGDLVLMHILAYTYDPTVQWNIPDGSPPYEPLDHGEEMDTENLLRTEARKLYLFDKNQAPNLEQIRAERLFVDLLESVHPKDAEILINVRNGRSLAKGLTRKIVQEAWPGLLNTTELENA